ncbi:hypothetical protein ABIC65_002620 [Sphingomonas trueperi]
MPEDKAHRILPDECRNVDRVFAILLYLSQFCDWVAAP